MADTTKIEWTDATFNPWVGCTKVSPACDHCYAEGWAKRAGSPELWTGQRRRTSAANWRLPHKLNAKAVAEGRRIRVFCASLADVFDNQVPDEWRHDLFQVIRETPQLDWQLLTKRPQNIRRMLPTDWGDGLGYRNVWLGTTVENQAEADRRIPHLLSVPAERRFLSCEPLLGPLDLGQLLPGLPANAWLTWLDGLDWVICGGESGPGARPMHPDWARLLRDQCEATDTAFLFKQWGEWVPMRDGGIASDWPVMDRNGNVRDWMNRYVVADGDLWAARVRGHSFTGHATDLVYRIGKARAGRLLDGVDHREFPE